MRENKLKILLGPVPALIGMFVVFATATVASPLPLRVVIIPSTNQVRIPEPFGITVRVENHSRTNQTIRMMSCSWEEEWKSSNTNVNWAGWECTWNVETDVVIPPSGAFTNATQMYIHNSVRSKEVSFSMGFTSIGSTKTLWSNKVKLRVLPPDTWWRDLKYFRDRNHDGKIDWEVSGKMWHGQAVYPRDPVTNSAGVTTSAPETAGHEVFTYKVDTNYDGFYDVEYGAGDTNGQIQWTKLIHEKVPALGKDFIPVVKEAWMDWSLPK